MSGIAIRSGNISPFRVGTFGADPAGQDSLDVLFDGNASPLRIMQRSLVLMSGSGWPELRADWNTYSQFALNNPSPAGQYPLFICCGKSPSSSTVHTCPYTPNGFGAGTSPTTGMGVFFGHSQKTVQPTGEYGQLNVPQMYVSVLVFKNRF